MQSLLIAILSTCLSLQPTFASELQALLDEMSTAMSGRTYEGILVLTKPDSLESMRVVHVMDKERGVWESLESLNGEARKVIRYNGEVTTVYPRKKLVTVSRMYGNTPLHPQLPDDLQQLEQYYKLELIGSDRVAARKTRVVDIKPRDNYRYGFRYWIENKTGMLLRCDLKDEHGKVVEQLMFTSVRFLDKAPKSSFSQLRTPGFQVTNLDLGRKNLDTSQWKVQRLPIGFMLVQNTLKSGKTRDDIKQHMVYSDGLATVSVFIEKSRKGKQELQGISRMGAINTYGMNIGDHHVTVMGEVPEVTVKRIAQSMVRIQ